MVVCNGKYRVATAIAGDGECNVYAGASQKCSYPIYDITLKTVLVYRRYGSFGRPLVAKVIRQDDSTDLNWECSIIETLWPTVHVPRPIKLLYESGYQMMLMERGGPSLQRLLTQRGQFPLKVVLDLGCALISELEKLHKCDYIHRSIKPDNLIIGQDQQTVLFIDFETAKKFKSIHGHIENTSNQAIMGTARYASLHSHLGMTLSRRDDCQSLLYTLIELRNGILPWGRSRDRSDMANLKRQTDRRLHGSADGFGLMQRKINALHFSQRPNYRELRRILQNMRSEHFGRVQPDRINRGDKWETHGIADRLAL